MNSRRARSLILPATLAVTTFASAQACTGSIFEPFCGDIESMDKCAKAEGCGWSQEYDECVNICHEIADQAECEAIDRCEWYPDGPPDSGDETSGDQPGGCGEPFT